jgi:aspartyl/asparaginyl beta-hydroxylase (cupin superfamily)
MDKTKSHEIAFYSIDDFPQFKILEENYQALLDELKEVTGKKENNKKIKHSNLFEPWVEKNLYEESNDQGWDVAPLMIGGVLIDERCQKFPVLYSLIDKLKGIMSVSYSLLKPGTHIVPHKGYDDYSEKVLRYHMGMIIPKGDIALRVDKEIRSWQCGRSFIFDDYLVHEAWNFSNEDRIVLIIDFLREEQNNVIFVDNNFNNSIKGYFKN